MTESTPSAKTDDVVRASRAGTSRCVVVDDDLYFLKLTEIVVVKARPDFEIVQFCDAVSALDFLSHQRADLVITDVRMPVMNGLQLTSAIRAIYRDLPIIVISSDNHERQALEHGASAFLTKNLVNEQLGAVIARLCAPAG